LKKFRNKGIDGGWRCGAIAQLGERYDGIVEVRSSILLGSTIFTKIRNQGHSHLHRKHTSLSAYAVEAYKTLNTLFEQLEKVGFDGECDGHSLAFDSKKGQPYLLNYHGVTHQIWLASPTTGAHHFRLEDGRWVSTRGTEELISLLESELNVNLS
jgi:frataxin